MKVSHRGRFVLVVIFVLCAVAVMVGLLLVLDTDGSVPAVDNESPSAIARWCDDLTEAFEPAGPLTSFEDVVEAAADGRLIRPKDDPPLRDEAGYRAWQRAHGEYTASSYLQLLESTPKPMVFTAAAIAVVIADGHVGQAPDNPRDAYRNARALDRFHRRAC